MVIATQNPIEMEGTYPLPEAQRDRFMARLSMGYPEPAAELRMLDGHAAAEPLLSLQPVTDGQQILRLVKTVHSVHVSESVKEYAVALVGATRRSQELRLGASPRATLHLVRAARAAAALDSREFVLPDDIQELAVPVLAHRVLPAAEAHLGGRGAADIISGLVASVPLPRTRRD
jgi:MoxR-like ATPase